MPKDGLGKKPEEKPKRTEWFSFDELGERYEYLESVGHDIRNLPRPETTDLYTTEGRPYRAAILKRVKVAKGLLGDLTPEEQGILGEYAKGVGMKASDFKNVLPDFAI